MPLATHEICSAGISLLITLAAVLLSEDIGEQLQAARSISDWPNNQKLFKILSSPLNHWVVLEGLSVIASCLSANMQVASGAAVSGL